MTYTITKTPHPLDAIWSDAAEAYSDAVSARDALDTLGEGCTDEQIDAAADAVTAAIMTIMALPARNVADSLFKLDCAGIDDGNIRTDCDPSAIINEANDVLNAAIARGRQKEVPA